MRLSMRSGMAMLAGCVRAPGLGRHAGSCRRSIRITRQAFGVDLSRHLISENGLRPDGGLAEERHPCPRVLLALMLIALSAIPLLLWMIWGRRAKRSAGPAWDCGLPGLTADNEYTATAFSKPLRMIFAALFRPRREMQAEYEVSPYYPKAIHFESEIQPAFEKHFYDPLPAGILRIAAACAWSRREACTRT